MTSAVAPTIHSLTVAVTNTSASFPIPSVDYDHVLVCSNRDIWIAVGDSTVVAVREAAGAVYLPRDTLLEVPTRRYQVDGLTHIAVIKETGANGFANFNFGNQIITDTDLLMNIHSCLMHMLQLHAGDAAHPHYPCEQLTHTDVTE